MRALPLTILTLSAVIGSGVSSAGGGPAAAEETSWPATSRASPASEHRLWAEMIVKAPDVREHLQVLTAAVEEIWAPYAVTFAWRETPPPSLAPDGFSGWVRILIDRNATDHLKAGTARHPAIAALHMPNGVPRNVVYVSLDGARTLLRRGNLSALPPARQDSLVARIAGRAIAHELGHYLLQTSAHAASGLMRAEFTRADLLESGVRRFQLTPVNTVRLAERLFLERQAILARGWSAGPP